MRPNGTVMHSSAAERAEPHRRVSVWSSERSFGLLGGGAERAPPQVAAQEDLLQQLSPGSVLGPTSDSQMFETASNAAPSPDSRKTAQSPSAYCSPSQNNQIQLSPPLHRSLPLSPRFTPRAFAADFSQSSRSLRCFSSRCFRRSRP